MAEFCHEVISWSDDATGLSTIEMAARIHHQLVFIHPFENGNGRFSRLVSDRFLLSKKCPHPIWPNQLNKEGVLRKDYIHTLKSADQGDFEPLVELMIRLGAIS